MRLLAFLMVFGSFPAPLIFAESCQQTVEWALAARSDKDLYEDLSRISPIAPQVFHELTDRSLGRSSLNPLVLRDGEEEALAFKNTPAGQMVLTALVNWKYFGSFEPFRKYVELTRGEEMNEHLFFITHQIPQLLLQTQKILMERPLWAQRLRLISESFPLYPKEEHDILVYTDEGELHGNFNAQHYHLLGGYCDLCLARTLTSIIPKGAALSRQFTIHSNASYKSFNLKIHSLSNAVEEEMEEEAWRGTPKEVTRRKIYVDLARLYFGRLPGDRITLGRDHPTRMSFEISRPSRDQDFLLHFSTR